MKKAPGRKPRFLNQLERRRLRRLGMLPFNKAAPRLPDRVNDPHRDQVIDALAQAIAKGMISQKAPTKEEIKK